MKNIYGLIGKTLTHSFSREYFIDKFSKDHITNSEYILFELSEISKVVDLLRQKTIRGLNVTIPYKKSVIEFLDEVDPVAQRIGAVNVIKTGNRNIGYNSDYHGFKISLQKWVENTEINDALVLGNGGAAAAVKVVLEDLSINYKVISRRSERYNYETLNKNPEFITKSQLIINTTPLGTFPKVHDAPELNYSFISDQHFLYDLVYNPSMTQFMKNGQDRGAKVKNGLEMLQLQAEKAWEIWNNDLGD